MTANHLSDHTSQADVDRLLADPALAALEAGGAPLIVAASAPLRVIWANGAAQSLLRAGTLEDISQRVFFEKASVGRLAELAGSMFPGAPPRLERVRMLIWRRMETFTFLCRRTTGSRPLFVAAAVGVKLSPLDVARPPLSAFGPSASAATPGHTVLSTPLVPANDAVAAMSTETLNEPGMFAEPTPLALATPSAPPGVHRPSAADVSADLAGQFRNASVVRFLWKSDARHCLTEITGELCAVIGCDSPRLIGRDFLAVAQEFGAEPADRLVSAFARRETWSGVDVLWPVTGTNAAVPVTLGALPTFDRAKRFEGFRGFGVLHIQRIEPYTRKAAPSVPAEDAVADEDIISAILAPTVLATEASVVTPSAPASVELPEKAMDTVASSISAMVEPVIAAPTLVEAATVAQDESIELAADSAADTTAPAKPVESIDLPPVVSDISAIVEPAMTPPPVEATATQDDSVEADAESEPVAAIRTTPPFTGDVLAVDDESDALDREPSPAPPAQKSGANVVQLRAAYRVPQPPAIQPPPAANDRDDQKQTPGAKSPTGKKTNDKTASTDALQREPAAEAPSREDADHRKSPSPSSGMVELTPQERNAFREIARVLGAKAEAQADFPKSTPAAVDDETSEETTVETPRGLRIRDLIDIASEVAPAPAKQAEATPVLPATTAEPQHAPTPEFAIAASANSERDALSRNAGDILDRLPVGVVVSRLEVPLFVNRTLLDLLDFDDADAFHKAGGLDCMFRGRQPQSLTEAAGGGAIPIVTRTGDVLSVIARVQSIAWDGEPASLTTFRATREADLAPRVRSLEAELRHRDGDLRELHAILDTATDGVAVLDADGLILALNKSAEALFGYDQNEVAGESFTTLLAKESHAAANDYLAGLKSNGVASVLNDGRDVVGRARQGGAIPVFMTLGRVSAAGAQKFCAVLRDMTAWKKAERELSEARKEAERASALKSDFLAKVSHEIRTPLNAIIGFAEVIRDERFGPVGNERYKDYLKDIHSSGVHVMSLVNDLLDLSKIEAGKMELNFGAVDANKIVSECVSLMQPQATRERVVIRQALAPRLPNIVADERSLRQIVLNLLSNAVKFNEAGGQVIVSTALTDAGHAVIRIKDTGIGMNETEVQTALEPFRQLHTSRSRGGTGLGLPLTKSLVEANRASFTIKSKKKEGTLVEVAFPPTRVLAE